MTVYQESKGRAYIRHPMDMPIELELTQGTPPSPRLQNVSVGGLCCRSGEHLSPGARVRVRVPCVDPPFETEGSVVWCRHRNHDYDVGIRFSIPEDAFRARMVEQVCHIEQYRQKVLRTEGRCLNGDEAAQEWISRYAAQFPAVALT
ncbi:PilZ domain-containing protein [Gammaproteobacteria bacterium]